MNYAISVTLLKTMRYILHSKHVQAPITLQDHAQRADSCDPVQGFCGKAAQSSALDVFITIFYHHL